MAFAIGLLMKMGLPERAAKAALLAAAIAAVFLALWLIRRDAYNDGKHDERARIEKQIAADKLAQAERERKADAELARQRQIDSAAAAQRKQEIDNATQGLPDRSPSDRQRIRACIQLRAQARAARKPEPAC